MDRAISAVICLVWKIRRWRWSKINAKWVIWARGGSDVARPETPHSVNPKKTSLMTHPDALIKTYDISSYQKSIIIFTDLADH